LGVYRKRNLTMVEFLLSCFGFFLIFKAVDMGRVESEKFEFFSEQGLIQWLLILFGVLLNGF
jgi:hypothetical protein